MSSVHLSGMKGEELESYLSSLTPAAARFLIREVELDRLKGGSAFAHDIVLKYARKAIFNEGDKFNRIGSPLRVFCDPFEDLLVDNSTEEKQPGRISRSSLPAIWKWLGTDLVPSEMEHLGDALRDAIVEKSSENILATSLEIHRICAGAINKALHGITPGDRDYLRLAAHLGGPRVLEDATDIACILSEARLVIQVRKRLPGYIEKVGPGDEAGLAKLYQEAAAIAPGHAYIVLLSAAARMRRRSDVLKVVRRIVGSDEDGVIRSSGLAIVCECLLHDMEVAAHGALQAIASRAPIELVDRFLSHYFEIADGFVGIVDVDMKGCWGWRIIAIRNALASAIRTEISGAPRLVKTALYRRGLRTGTEGYFPVKWPDPHAVSDAKLVVQLLLAVRPYLSQVPINADYASINSTVSSFIESIGEITIEDVRRSEGEELECADAYMKNICEFTELFFGPEVTELLRRRARVALQRDEASKQSA